MGQFYKLDNIEPKKSWDPSQKKEFGLQKKQKQKTKPHPAKEFFGSPPKNKF